MIDLETDKSLITSGTEARAARRELTQYEARNLYAGADQDASSYAGASLNASVSLGASYRSCTSLYEPPVMIPRWSRDEALLR